ncbi:uncharacterized protein LOC119664742 [Teleopsis dalmanni]|uniref:uncharacterized protein LOC119664742 n=1 Tax=Teleopsis dalmanni TaxID=139649 RepID=UPI0018CED2FD|nr:uncharacterized protein LOC119664742 [Teleopsis dalmanni]XP_037930140.1 uncharacterized protein LOC119664742 [Teleopsis dalmanni]XP_037930178.1 uncharacterized protein LOC119664742 [Teleopsis dalmanni]
MNNQMNSAVRKIHNLLTSGAVTVTGPNQPRILKQKVGSTIVTPTNSITQGGSNPRCYVCDDAPSNGQAQHSLAEMTTSHTGTKYPNKIGQLVGDAFLVIVSLEDVVCARCSNLLNYLDRLESDVDRVRTNLLNLLQKKYNLSDEGGGNPPSKILKLNSGAAVRTAEESTDLNRARKMLQTTSGVDSSLGKQSPPVSAVQQIKISTQPSSVQQQQTGTQTMHRKPTRIYKCLSCDYKTSDMRLFNAHYETCKQQSFQCKNCKKIFSNFGNMKQHMVREHNTAMDNTCSVCHINFVSEIALRKHMELNHSTNILVTSSSTIPAGQSSNAVQETGAASTSLYTCNHCQFKSTDKVVFDEHMRKHIATGKPKPFKCRLCAQRFETREAATIHAKQHQPNYFKCGTCSMSFPKRELLVKHFEQHHPSTGTTQQTATSQSSTVTVKQIQQQGTGLTTQKLLQDTIDEALSESGVANAAGATEANPTGASNIQFYSCHICSLTFIQENYYNQHMDTHRAEKKGSNGNTSPASTATTAAHTNSTSIPSLNTAAATLLSDGLPTTAVVKGEPNTLAVQQSNPNSVDSDIESIFEKMHSDKADAAGGADTSATSAANTATTNTSSTTTGGQGNENLIITSQQGSGGITFNITIPRDATEGGQNTKLASSTTPVSVGIDMPMLDQPDESASDGKKSVKQEKDSDASDANNSKANAQPVNMPSLDDDNETQELHQSEANGKTKPNENVKSEAIVKSEDNSIVADANADSQESANTSINESEVGTNESSSDEHQQVAMEMDEAMQAQVESGQIKFILNENGQLLQLDNHILTDADGNQILVQDPEQIQQLLQSVGVLHSGDGLDGETIQMMTDGNGQMVLVQGENNETQLIDASLLNAGGQLVLHGQDGELGEGAHVIGEDGRRIPVSVSYTADGQPIVQVQQEVLEGGEGVVLEKDASATAGEDAQVSDSGTGAAGGGFFALEDLMQQSSDAKAAE